MTEQASVQPQAGADPATQPNATSGGAGSGSPEQDGEKGQEAVAFFDQLFELSHVGALCFGIVLGWCLFFNNRHRATIEVGDIKTIIAALAGPIVLAFLGSDTQQRATMVGAYGIGLSLGFFAYLLVLRHLVNNSDGAFDSLFFLDGRRRALPEGWVIPEDAAPANRPLLHSLFRRSERDSEADKIIARAKAASGKIDAVEALAEADSALQDAIAREANDAKRKKLETEQARLVALHDDLLLRRIRDTLSDPGFQAALNALERATKKLNKRAKELETAADVLGKAAEIVSAAADVSSAAKDFLADA